MMHLWATASAVPHYEGHKDLEAIFSFSGKVSELRNKTRIFADLPRVDPGGIMIMPQDFRDWMFCTHPKKFCRVVHLADGEEGTYKVVVCRCGAEF